jgi:hypothetical protein
MKRHTPTSAVCATCSETKNCRIEEALLSVYDPDDGLYHSGQIGCVFHIWPDTEYHARMLRDGYIPDKAYKLTKLLENRR